MHVELISMDMNGFALVLIHLGKGQLRSDLLYFPELLLQHM